ncbi:MAG: YqeG family HAD IIIA-type phosphatase [Lachnospiraceae bacterium]|nr:YqeG family HAD IIIA-type phosphatase [Lachnospiraceae bacterium]
MTKFYPQNYIDSTYNIPFEELYNKGFRGLIFDIDNTLVEHGAPANAKAVELFKRLKKIGFKTMILSNNNERRVKSFAGSVASNYIHKAGKPKRKNYLKAMEIMGTDIKTSILIGDQLFTDIWGANRLRMNNYLVAQIDKKEEIQIVIKRFFEKPILYFYKKKNRGNR